MKFGADRKRLTYLGALVLLGGTAIWTNGFSSWGSGDSSSPSARPAPAAPVAPAAGGVAAVDHVPRRKEGQQLRSSDWHPVYRDPKVVVDASKVDPTLRLDLLAKVQQVEIDRVQRNLFQFGAAPPPPPDKSPIPNPNRIQLTGNRLPPGPVAPPQPTGPPPPPVAPPITFKYYGYSNARDSTRKRAFFLDGDDIIIAGEGELIKKRYRLVKIGVNSVTMEDTQFSSQQTLPLAEDLTSANAANPSSLRGAAA